MAKSTKKEEQPQASGSEVMIAAIRIRGSVMVTDKIEDTLKMLNLKDKNNCVVLPCTPSVKGMLRKAKDYITWGEIDAATLKELKEKRAETFVNKAGETVVKPVFRLHPPRGGFDRGGIKKSFTVGGALGYRAENINTLIRKMI